MPRRFPPLSRQRLTPLLLGLALLLAAPTPGICGPEKRDLVPVLLERYRSVEGRHDDEGYETARIVLEQMADLGTEEARKTLRELASTSDLKNGDRRRLGIVLTALVRQGGPGEIDLAIKVAESTREDFVVDALPHYLAAARRPEGVQHLRTGVFPTATPAVKAQVARALGLMGDREAVVALLVMLREEDVRVRSEVLLAIADLGDESAFPHLSMFLKAADARLREVAARALGVLGSSRAVPHLIAALADPAPLVAESAARSLGLLGSPAGVVPLIDRLAIAVKPAPAVKPVGPVDPRASDLRLADTIEKALERLTGMALGDDPDLWRAWWKENKDKPPADTARPNAPTTVSGPRYYGFGVRSSRVMFVLDVSGSMSWNERLETARKELIQVLEHLPSRTRFSLVTFSDRADSWTDKLVYATPENVRKAVRHVERLQPMGGTDSFDALRLAFKDEDVDTIFFLSDGSPTLGAVTDPDAILADVRELNRFRRVRVNTIALIMGDPPPEWVRGENRAAMIAFMKRLAEQNDGKYVEKH